MMITLNTATTPTPELLPFDLVVAGGGIGGCVTAIAAARSGCKTALIQDRSVLGGNASSEINVLVAGANAMDYNPHARETGIIEEILVETSARSPSRSSRMIDDVLWEWVTREANIELFLNTHVTGVQMHSPALIAALDILQYPGGRRLTLRANLFADCTGDAVVAHEAGAAWRMGREGKTEFGESLAPDQPDGKTLGCTLPFQYRDLGRPVAYTPPPFARDFSSPDSFPMRHHTLPENHFWWVEWGGELDCIHQYQEIKDELTRVVYGIWDHLKNHGEHGAENFALIRIGHLLGKRESRRVEGDYMLTENDLVARRVFEDAVAYGGWPIDLHPPEGVYSKEAPADQIFVEPYDIPYRCLYSRDVENLFLAGRDISVSHVALGSTRVMATIATMGQAIGTAAGFCRRDGINPRELGRRGLRELQKKLLRDDAYLVNRPNEDEADLARSARVSATSDAPLEFLGGQSWKPLGQGCAQKFPITAGRLETIELFLKNTGASPAPVTIKLFESRELWDFTARKPIAEAVATLPAHSESWTPFHFGIKLPPGSYWIAASFSENVEWRRTIEHEPLGTKTAEWDSSTRSWAAYRGDHRVDTATWIPFRGCFAFRLTPESRPHSGNQSVNGFARPLDWPNLWVSDPAQPLPQSLTFEFPHRVTLGSVLLAFDTDLDHRVPPRFCPLCVRDYALWARVDGDWRRIVDVTGNYQRRRVHQLDHFAADALRIEVTATNGAPSARIFEVRAYAAEAK